MPTPPATAATAPPLSRRDALGWLAALALSSAAPAVRARVDDDVGGFDRGLLWRVERPNVAPSHLFGTLHLDDPRALDFRPPVRRAFAAARVLVLEMLEDDASARRFAQASRLEGGATLREVAGAEVAARVAAVLGSRYGMPPEISLRLKPWAAYLALVQPTRPPGEIVDAALRRMARQRGLPVRPLETVDEQLQALEAVPEASQVALLDAVSRRHDEAQAAIPVLLERYLDGDLSGLLRLQFDAVDGEPALHAPLDDLLEHLLRRRNERMAQRLHPVLRQGRAFAAMGALHLHGPEGVPARLQRAGWRVRPVAN
jgi:uncharacterized protein YbaP (TraB family)